MIPTTRTEFQDYCLRKLGAPVTVPNVSQEQIDDRIDEALTYFYETHYNGTEVGYLIVELDENTVEDGFMTLPNDIIFVADVFKLTSSNSGLLSDFNYQLQDMYNSGYSTMFRTGDLTYYYMINSHIKLLNRFFNPHPTFQFNELTGRLSVLGGFKKLAKQSGYVGVKVYKKILGEASQHPTSGNTERIANIWANRWLCQFAAALIMKQWGQNLTKYKDVTLLGGYKINGDQLSANADAEILKLEAELQDKYRPLIPFIMG